MSSPYRILSQKWSNINYILFSFILFLIANIFLLYLINFIILIIEKIIINLGYKQAKTVNIINCFQLLAIPELLRDFRQFLL